MAATMLQLDKKYSLHDEACRLLVHFLSKSPFTPVKNPMGNARIKLVIIIEVVVVVVIIIIVTIRIAFCIYYG